MKLPGPGFDPRWSPQGGRSSVVEQVFHQKLVVTLVALGGEAPGAVGKTLGGPNAAGTTFTCRVSAIRGRPARGGGTGGEGEQLWKL